MKFIKVLYITVLKDIITLRTGDANLRFYIKTAQDG